MALLECPTRNDLPSYNYVISLDGTNYGLSFTYNSRMGKWLLELTDAFQNSIIAPVPVVAMWPLFDRFVGNAIPPGRLFCYDSSGQNLDPSRYDLGDRCRIYYDEADTK